MWSQSHKRYCVDIVIDFIGLKHHAISFSLRGLLLIFLSSLVLLFCCIKVAFADCPIAEKNPKLGIFLLLGQSNMAGRGREPVSPAKFDELVRVYRGADLWEALHEPIKHLGDNQEKAGTGLGGAFAREVVFKNHAAVGLVPLAVGGSELARWEAGGDLYVAALQHAKNAKKCGEIKAILWHQGESDAGSLNSAKSYARRFSAMINAFRRELGQETLPVLVGTLGGFIDQYKGGGLCCWREVNSQIVSLPKVDSSLYVIDSTGLVDRGDGIHFNTASQQELGLRYAKAYFKIIERR